MFSNWCNAILVHAETTRDLADIRRDTRSEFAEQEQEARRQAAERDVANARLAAQREQFAREFCIANQEAQQEQLQRQIKDTVQSKVAFNVEQGLEVGELEVDTVALKELLDKREQEQKQPPTQNQNQKQPCPCCDRACGCGSGFLRRLCPHCRHKRCECEKDCGGQEQIAQLQQQPQVQPLRPAEIPMKLPVRLTFGFQQPQIEQTKVRHQPQFQEQNQGCPNCTTPGGVCPGPDSCVVPVPTPKLNSGAPVGGGEVAPKVPAPEPEPEVEAFFQLNRPQNAQFPTMLFANTRYFATKANPIAPPKATGVNDSIATSHQPDSFGSFQP